MLNKMLRADAVLSEIITMGRSLGYLKQAKDALDELYNLLDSGGVVDREDFLKKISCIKADLELSKHFRR